jgi:hypothetical protein
MESSQAKVVDPVVYLIVTAKRPPGGWLAFKL